MHLQGKEFKYPSTCSPTPLVLVWITLLPLLRLEATLEFVLFFFVVALFGLLLLQSCVLRCGNGSRLNLNTAKPARIIQCVYCTLYMYKFSKRRWAMGIEVYLS